MPVTFEPSWIHVIEIVSAVVIYLIGVRRGLRVGAARERERIAVMIQRVLGILWSPTLHQVVIWIDGGQSDDELMKHTAEDADERALRKRIGER